VIRRYPVTGELGDRGTVARDQSVEERDRHEDEMEPLAAYDRMRARRGS
jgi:hypothetical protein